jgi:hypothetical protein
MGFGGMKLTGPRLAGPPADRDAALAVLRRAVELGVQHIETSDHYGPHVVNQLVREAPTTPWPKRSTPPSSGDPRRRARLGQPRPGPPRGIRLDHPLQHPPPALHLRLPQPEQLREHPHPAYAANRCVSIPRVSKIKGKAHRRPMDHRRQLAPSSTQLGRRHHPRPTVRAPLKGAGQPGEAAPARSGNRRAAVGQNGDLPGDSRPGSIRSPGW